MELPLALTLALACTLLVGVVPVEAVTCAPTGCTYEDLGCYGSMVAVDCDGPKGQFGAQVIEGPVNITNIPSTVQTLLLRDNQIVDGRDNRRARKS